MNCFEVFHLRGVLCPKFDEHWNAEYEITVAGCQYEAVLQGELAMFASPLRCSGTCIDEIRSWNGRWNGWLEHRGGDSDSSLVNESDLCGLGARNSEQTNHVYQQGEPHTMEHRHRMCTDNDTAEVTAPVPR